MREVDPATQWLRRGLFGYRRQDVVVLLELQRKHLDELAASVERLWAEKRALADELVDVRARYELELAQERSRAEQAESTVRAKAATIVAEAEEQAARIRAEASRRVGDSAQRLEGVLRVREQLLGELRGILDAYGGLLERAEVDRIPTVSQPVEVVEPRPRGALAGDHAPAGADVFGRRVELDAGPFSDFAELAQFERSLAQLPKVEDVYIRSFADERAAIEVTLSEETPLVHELRRLPYSMEVTPGDDSRLTVEVEQAAAS